MRLSPAQVSQIVALVRSYIDNDAQVWLFGSRADDHRKGGDIDLYVESRGLDRYMAAIRCKVALEDFFDQRVDLIVNDFTTDKPIFHIAKTRGVKLCPNTLDS